MLLSPSPSDLCCKDYGKEVIGETELNDCIGCIIAGSEEECREMGGRYYFMWRNGGYTFIRSGIYNAGHK